MLNQQTPEELELVKDYILLPIMQQMIDKECSKIEQNRNVLNRMYLTIARLMLRDIRADFFMNRAEIRKLGIKVVELPESSSVELRYKYICRGYEYSISMPRSTVRGEISVRMGRYTGRIESCLVTTPEKS